MFHLPFVLCVTAINQEVGNLVADIAPAINARLFPSLGGTNIREVLYLRLQTFQTQPRQRGCKCAWTWVVLLFLEIVLERHAHLQRWRRERGMSR